MSDEQKHTPGPWQASCGIDDDDNRWAVLTKNRDRDYLIAIIENGAPGDTLKTEEANAHLMAAAPELLEACKAVSEFGIPDRDAGPLMVQLYEAIAKAEGKEAAI